MITIVTDDLPHMLLFPICRTTLILLYCVVEIFWYTAIDIYFLSYPCIIYPVLSFNFVSHHSHQQTLLKFISRPKSASIIVIHHLPSADQSKFCHQTLYLLIILSPPIRIPYIRSIIVTPHHWCLFLIILPPLHTHSRPYLSSSSDLSSV